MSGVKIGPQGGPPQVSTDRLEAEEPRVEGAAGNEPPAVTEVGDQGLPFADLIDQVRQGQVTVDEVVSLLADRALSAGPAAHASEAVRAEIKDALSDMVRDDPALAALVKAMGR